MKIVLFLTFHFFYHISPLVADCPFCNQEIIRKQFVHDTDLTTTLYCLTPATKGNLLIIPKRHIERFEQLTAHKMERIQNEINLLSSVFKNLYGISEFVILQKNGRNAGQSVAHLHFHMIPAPKPFDEIVHTAFHCGGWQHERWFIGFLSVRFRSIGLRTQRNNNCLFRRNKCIELCHPLRIRCRGPLIIFKNGIPNLF
jgi:diadenosine tetraphosphate (Ap4A) HIT family hydrolase